MNVARVLGRLDELGAVSDAPDVLVRTFCSKAMRRANQLVALWMRGAGLTTRTDAAGNLVGRLASPLPGAKTLLMGSHLDTVPDAGKYDGPLGVVAAIEVVQALARSGRPLPFHVEVLGFSDEEGVRFHSTYLGSSAVAGCFDPAWLEMTDADGLTMAGALRSFGCDPDAIPGEARRRGDVLAYLELHIEQGPVLDARGLPVAVVDAIAGQTRATMTFRGAAGHAGTTPMDVRLDAFAAAAEWTLAVEAAGRGEPGAVATVGRVKVEPGASNVVPGLVTLSLDVRHARDAVRSRLVSDLDAAARQIAERRGVACELVVSQESPAVALDPDWAARLARAAREAGWEVPVLTSGAGHDAAVMAGLCPAAMLFVACDDGVSHNPAEAVREPDVDVALTVLEQAILSFAEELS